MNTYLLNSYLSNKFPLKILQVGTFRLLCKVGRYLILFIYLKNRKKKKINQLTSFAKLSQFHGISLYLLCKK